MDIQVTFEKISRLQSLLEVDPKNNGYKQKLVHFIGDVVEYTFMHCEDKPLLKVIMNFLVEVFFNIAELNNENMDDILDILTRARILVRECMDDSNDE
jgi:hypothetical protein